MGHQVPASVLREVGGRPGVEHIELAPPAAGQVRVKLAATGVCHSDLSLATGKMTHVMPVVLGHEGAGVVVEIGPAVAEPTGAGPDPGDQARSVFAVGDRVVLNWAPACRNCWFCEHGEPYLC